MLRIVKLLFFVAIITLYTSVTCTEAQTIRTLVAHELTHETASGVGTNACTGNSPRLSQNGNRAVYSTVTVEQSTAYTAHIKVIDFAGAGLREVDTYPLGNTCISKMDISANGNLVLSLGNSQIRVASADGSTAQTVVTYDGGYVWPRLTADGTKVIFSVQNGTSIGSTPVERGIWVMNANGSGVQPVVGINQIGALLGVPPAEVNFECEVLDVSADGSRIVFGAGHPYVVAEHGLFGVNLDGSELRHYLFDNFNWVISAGISSDGAKIFYNINHLPCCSSPSELGVMNWDGTGRNKLKDNITPTGYPNGWAGFHDPVSLSQDGSRLLFGSTSMLFDTATGTSVQLGVRGNYGTYDPPPLLYDGMDRPAMSGDASRFTYIATTGNDSNIGQLATLEIDPSSFGEAPLVYEPQIVPSYILTNHGNDATVSAMVTTSNTVLRVGSAVLRDGLLDSAIYTPVLLPDGTGRYVGPNIYTYTPPLGPRTVRVKAEAAAADGKAHATEIEFSPFEVRDTVPTYLLTVSKSGTGVGEVTTDKGALTWTGPTGTAQFDDNTTVALSASAGTCSSFISWSGDCSGTLTPCNLVMSQARSVNAVFDLLAEVRNQSTLATYGSIQEALNYVSSGDKLLIRAASFVEQVIFHNTFAVTLLGGRDCSYQPTQQMTTIIGSLTIVHGSLNIDSITIR